MNLRNNTWKIPVLVAILHCILGNAWGAKSDNTFIQTLFLPYSFIGGMSDFAGWGFLSYFLELGGLAVMIIVFHPIGLWLYKGDPKNEETKR
ncbi:MAG TPA: hypothetical protein VIM79_27780 [Niastella sp.]